MSDQSFEEILAKLNQMEAGYYRLMLVLGPYRSGKTKLMQEIADTIKAPLVNVNLELSRRLLELSVRERALQASEHLREILDEIDNDVVLLDNIELLFAEELELDPLRLLQYLSRQRTIIATWNGCVRENHLTYAEPGHHEYHRYPVQDVLYVLM
jgi:predicted AAA+ superfamily ATPase